MEKKQKFKVGDRVRVVSNELEHDTPIDTEIIVLDYDKNDNTYSCVIEGQEENGSFWYAESDLARIPKQYHIQEHYTTTVKLKWYAVPTEEGWSIADEAAYFIGSFSRREDCEMIVELYNQAR